MAEIKNIVQLFLNSVSQYGDQTGFSYKKNGSWVKVSYKELEKKVNSFSATLLELGLKKGDKIALLSENRMEWAISDLAILSIGCMDIPIYPTNTSQKVKYLLENSESVAMICSTLDQLKKIEEIRKELPKIKHVICMDMEKSSEDVLSFQELLKKGAKEWEGKKEEIEKLTEEIKEDDLATFIYTSGTTGDPKGVMLTHKNFVSNVLDASVKLPITKTDSALSFLPLSHSFERCCGYYLMMHNGATIYYAEGIASVPHNMAELSPTLMCSVPRLYEKMYAKIMDAANSGSALKKNIFSWALRSGEAHRMAEYEGKNPGFLSNLKYKIADKLVFSKIRAKTGGKIKFFASGGAPLSPEIMKFFYVIGILILEGYGLSETSPMLTLNSPDAFRFGTVGKALPQVTLKIDEKDGEILAKGPNIMVGYYKKEEATKEAIDEDGWFHTGDVGVLEDGFLRITDRKKDLIITAGGKNVAPQYLENLFKTDAFIDEFVVIGDKKKYLSALVVPNLEKLAGYAQEEGISFEAPKSLTENQKIQTMMEGRIEVLNKKLARYETIKKITLLKEAFSEDSGELTPTLKVKRKVVNQKYKEYIDKMYPTK